VEEVDMEVVMSWPDAEFAYHNYLLAFIKLWRAVGFRMRHFSRNSSMNLSRPSALGI